MNNNNKTKKEFDFSFLPPLPTAHDFTEKFRKENKGNPQQLPFKIRALLLDAFSMCENETEAVYALRLIECLRDGYLNIVLAERNRQERIKAAFLKNNSLSELQGKLVYMKGKQNEGCYGFWDHDLGQWGIRQPHKDNKFVVIGNKQGCEVVGKNIFEYHAALVGYIGLKHPRNPLKTIEKLNNYPEIKTQIDNVVIHFNTKTGELPPNKIKELIPLVKQLWEE